MKWKCVGVDGTRGGWIAASLGGESWIHKFDDIASLCRICEDADCILIDIPIGLAESERDVRPEAALRKRLPGKASSVFTPPCRQALYEDSCERVCAVNQSVLGKKISLQAYHISKKIREVDVFLQAQPDWADRLWEGHPELGFAVLNSGTPLAANKRRRQGREERFALLRRACPKTEGPVCEAFLDRDLRRRADDVLDAACLAAIGLLGMERGFETIPAEPMRDARGIPMRIVSLAPNR